MSDLTLWNKLTRREQRLAIELFGGGSTHADGLVETVNLMPLDLVSENGLTSAGLGIFVAAFQSATRRLSQSCCDPRELHPSVLETVHMPLWASFIPRRCRDRMN